MFNRPFGIEESERARFGLGATVGTFGYADPIWSQQANWALQNPFVGQIGFPQTLQNPYIAQQLQNPFVAQHFTVPVQQQALPYQQIPFGSVNPFVQALHQQPVFNPYVQQFGFTDPKQIWAHTQTQPFAGYGQIPLQAVNPHILQALYSNPYLSSLQNPYAQVMQQQLLPFGQTVLNPLAALYTQALMQQQQPYFWQQQQQLPVSVGTGIPYTGFVPQLSEFQKFSGLAQKSEFGSGQFGQQEMTKRMPKGYRRADDRIKDDIIERLTMHPAIDASDLEVIVKDGEVTLRGVVDDRISKRIVEEIAESVFGVRDCLNEIRVTPKTGIGREREQEFATATKGKEK